MPPDDGAARASVPVPEPEPALEAGAAPVRRQYLQIKRRFPETILLFRLGDFYETFEADAEIASSVLDIVLTGRDLGKGVRVPMAGIPHHAAEAYIGRLVAAGHKVAICEQIGAANGGRGLIDRDVTRVVTPGTVTDPAMLDSRRNSYIAAVVLESGACGVAYADITTGEFATTQLRAAKGEDIHAAAARELLRLGAVEAVVPDERASPQDENGDGWIPAGLAVSTTDRWQWSTENAERVLLEHFAVESLDGYGLSGQRLATRAAGGLLAYLIDTQRSRVAQISSVHTYSTDGYMVLDAQARRTLELTESSRGERRHGLVGTMDETRTPMGARLLRRWLSQPLLDLEAIRGRQDAIEFCVSNATSRSECRKALGGIVDVERLANRAVVGGITPRELGGLRQSLAAIVDLFDGTAPIPGCTVSPGASEACREIHALLSRALPDEPDVALGTGATIRPGFAPELDEHGRTVREAREWIASLERNERERTGIRTLKVGFNRVSGYFIEISTNAQRAAEKENVKSLNGAAVPDDYVLRQSLASSTRYVTTLLKSYEAQVVGAQERLAQIEADVYGRLVSDVAAHVKSLLAAAQVVAYLDVVTALAVVAAERAYVRPVVDDSRKIEILGGRHPTLERFLPPGEFVPNDAVLDDDGHAITILTGPNMAGKSSWLRQVALIVLMAQIGSFVPAASARIGLVDRIFTRIGAHDDITSGQSTFMVEMLETANILHHASPRSLILLDEIGRGTSTWDGLAIARAIVEYVHNAPRLGSRTLFATHFHELTALADLLPGVCCARVDVLEEGERIVFLHHVVPGAADRSYGIHVAGLAGVPRALTRRAAEILYELEHGPGFEERRDRQRAVSGPNAEPTSMQLTFFAPESPVVQAIKRLDVESLTPLEALTKLYELHQMATAEERADT